MFAGDFSQLPPPGGDSLLKGDFNLWEGGVDTSLELRTNHRFKDDPEWGYLLECLRGKGLTKDQVATINTRVVKSNQPIPKGIPYASHENKDRCATNDGIPLQHVRQTHSRDPSDVPPNHTVIVLASNLKFKVAGGRYEDMPDLQRNILLTCCADADVCCGREEVDPMLKLYVGCPVMITENLDVEHKIANGSMATFKQVILKQGTEASFVSLDGYRVRCVAASDVQHIEVVLGSGPHTGNQDTRELQAHKFTATAKFPDALDLADGWVSNLQRRAKVVQLSQFPLNIANGRTVHKLQGASLENLLVSNWSYTPNWVYVVLSRVRTMAGLSLRLPLNHERLESTETIDLRAKTKLYFDYFRQTKSPLSA